MADWSVVNALQAEGRHAEAVALLDGMIRKRAAPEAWYLRALSYAALGRPTPMLRDLQAAVGTDPIYKTRAPTEPLLEPYLANPYVRLAIGAMPEAEAAVAEMYEGEFDEAAQAFDTLLAARPDDATLHFLRGICAQELGDLERALAEADRVIASLPSLPDAWLNRGAALEGLRRADEAIEAYQAAARVDVEFVNGWFNLGMLLVNLGRLEEAEGAWRGAVAVLPGDALVRYKLAETLGRRGRREEALAVLAQSIAIDPDVTAAARENEVFSAWLGDPDFEAVLAGGSREDPLTAPLPRIP